MFPIKDHPTRPAVPTPETYTSHIMELTFENSPDGKHAQTSRREIIKNECFVCSKPRPSLDATEMWPKRQEEMGVIVSTWLLLIILVHCAYKQNSVHPFEGNFNALCSFGS